MNGKIPSLPEALLALIRHGENYQFEYKEARSELPKSLFILSVRFPIVMAAIFFSVFTTPASFSALTLLRQQS